MKTICVTGIAGFLGHHFCEAILKTTNWNIIGLDRLTYASSGFDRLRDIGAYNHPRIKVFTHDFSCPIVESLAAEIGSPDVIVHLGAETHVDRSIQSAYPFVVANVLGTMRMLDFARTLPNLKKFVYFSTDEVFGDAPAGVAYKEWDRYNSRNPYAASKAGGEELALAYAHTYNLPVLITHCMNVFGERQHTEKFIPIVMNKLRNGEELEIHCSQGLPASRSWIHARNASAAVMFLVENTPTSVRDKYNIPGEEVDLVTLSQKIAAIMDRPLMYRTTDYYANRPGHDPRYMLDGSKIANLGWMAPVDFDKSLEKTVRWTMENQRWLNW